MESKSNAEIDTLKDANHNPNLSLINELADLILSILKYYSSALRVLFFYFYSDLYICCCCHV